MTSYVNLFGTITYNNYKLEIITHNYYNKKHINEFIDNLKQIYTDIQSNFIIIANLNKTSPIFISSNIYYKVANIFYELGDISDKYLHHVIIINSNKIVNNLLSTLFKYYSMPHPISIIHKTTDINTIISTYKFTHEN